MAARGAPERRAIIVANGDADQEHLRALVASDPRPLVIAADGGARALMAAELRPDIVVGDGDSLLDADRVRLVADGVEVRLASPDKDESDTELCLLAAVEAGATRITLVGVFGGDRLEHSVANLLLLADPRLDGLEVDLLAGTSRVMRVGTDDGPARIEIAGMPGDYVSLFAVSGPVTRVRTSGLRFPLRGETLTVGPARGLSNELLERRADVETDAGRLLIVVTPRATLDQLPDTRGNQP